MSSPDESEPIYKLACECENLLDETISAATEPVAGILFTEYQQRFASWASYSGVFARKSRCLDMRLMRILPDIHDLVVRQLDILSIALAQCKIPKPAWIERLDTDIDGSTDQDNAGTNQPSRSVGEASPRTLSLPTEAVDTLKIIEDTLSELHWLGNTIHQSLSQRTFIETDAFIDGLDLRHFENMCSFVIQTMYPKAHHELRGRLGKSMMHCYVLILHRILHRSALQSRSPATSTTLSINKESSREDMKRVSEKSTSGTQDSGKDTEALQDMSKVSCEWCSDPLEDEGLEPRKWWRHVNSDLKPYICLSETCAESFPQFSTFDDWFSHMQTHGSRWYQEAFKVPSWICPICEEGDDSYPNQDALFAHLKQNHSEVFPTDTLRKISRHSHIIYTKPREECLICYSNVKDATPEHLASRERKRKNHPETGRSRKYQRKGSAAAHSGFQEKSCSEALESDEDILFISRHISDHLRSLMLLTIRLASLAEGEDDDTLDQDFKSDIVDIDSGNNSEMIASPGMKILEDSQT